MAEEVIKATIVFDTKGLTKSFDVGGKGTAGGGMTGMGGVAKLGMAAVAGGIVGAILASNKHLQRILERISKVLMLILKPITDILMVALMPLLYLFKPIAMFFNILMRPYLKQAMRAMSAGGKLLMQGQYKEAYLAFQTASAWMMKPFLDMFMKGMEFLGAGLVELVFGAVDLFLAGIQKLGEVILDVLSHIPGLGKAMEGAKEKWIATMLGVRESVTTTKLEVLAKWKGIMSFANDEITKFLTQATADFVAAANAVAEAARNARESRRTTSATANRINARFQREFAEIGTVSPGTIGDVFREELGRRLSEENSWGT